MISAPSGWLSATSSCSPARKPTSSSLDLLEFFAELTIYTSSACLIGVKFREELDERFAHLYHELERGTDAYCYVDWEFELAQPSETYRNDHSKMVVQLEQPCAVRYRRRRM